MSSSSCPVVESCLRGNTNEVSFGISSNVWVDGAFALTEAVLAISSVRLLRAGRDGRAKVVLGVLLAIVLLQWLLFDLSLLISAAWAQTRQGESVCMVTQVPAYGITPLRLILLLVQAAEELQLARHADHFRACAHGRSLARLNAQVPRWARPVSIASTATLAAGAALWLATAHCLTAGPFLRATPIDSDLVGWTVVRLAVPPLAVMVLVVAHAVVDLWIERHIVTAGGWTGAAVRRHALLSGLTLAVAAQAAATAAWLLTVGLPTWSGRHYREFAVTYVVAAVWMAKEQFAFSRHGIHPALVLTY